MTGTPMPETGTRGERSPDGDFLYLLQIYGVIAMHRGLQEELITAAETVIAPAASEPTMNDVGKQRTGQRYQDTGSGTPYICRAR
jgi:hypothetical protein